ncbi:hypothetical protein BON69_07005 [Escherichia coli]|nr:hypothetical protein BMU01_10285 [Escherichia coli]TEZ36615.1 hypothetical protein BON69_07005 [Escherichia coli]
MRRERLIRPTVRHRLVGMIRRVKRRIRHCAPTAGCGVNALSGLRHVKQRICVIKQHFGNLIRRFRA